MTRRRGADMSNRKPWRRSARTADAVGSLRDWVRRHEPGRDEPAAPEEPPIPRDLLDLLRRLGVALIGAVETTGRVQLLLEELAHRYSADGVHFIVLPTAVFVRVQAADGGSAVDLLDATVDTLRLDQIADLYRLIDRIKRDAPPPAQATADLDRILHSPPPTAVWLMLLGNVVLTVGLGLMLNPSPRSLIGYVVIGLAVQLLIMLAYRIRLLALALPVAAAATVTLLAFGLPWALSGSNPTELLIPGVAGLLPGAMLTNGTIELATGSMIAGASRYVYGINVLFLLAFGILIGLQILGPGALANHVVHYPKLGWWAPLIGVLLIGLGYSWRSSAPPNSVPWLLLVLYATYAAQTLGSLRTGPLGAFLGGLVAVPAAYLVQRSAKAPPTQVLFLPAFWMLVPGGIGLTGVSDLITRSDPNGLHIITTTLLTIMSIALGVMVGSGLVTARRPHLTPMLDKLLPQDDSAHDG